MPDAEHDAQHNRGNRSPGVRVTGTTPAMAATMPITYAAPGCSPRKIPTATRIPTPVAVIGAARLIFPTAIAWKNAARPTVMPRPAPAAAATVPIGGIGSAANASHPATSEHDPDDLGAENESQRADAPRRRAAEKIPDPVTK